ncbi:hypothetical protein [Vibrio crassostreae]|uniref:hypothetical protein n=1 Tax=Vibrio crassostreae TaxID=246167 RepID=UPI001B307BFD|nr:hypothetical protein [Vibrio crassostreae]
MKSVKEDVINLIIETEKEIDQEQRDELITPEIWMKKRAYLRSVTYVAYDVEPDLEGAAETLVGIVSTINLIKKYR